MLCKYRNTVYFHLQLATGIAATTHWSINIATSFPGLQCEDEGRDEEALVWAGHVSTQSRTQSNACARARMALALGKLNFSCAVIGLTCMPTKPEPLNLGVPVVNFPRANAILARAQALLWVRDWCLPKKWQYLTATRQGVARYSLMKYTSLRNK